MSGLGVFRDPRSVAVVGASDRPEKWGHWLARGALTGRHRRRVHLVNARGGEVLSRPCHRDLDALPEVPELVAFAVPAAALADGVARATGLGVPGLLAITAGVPDEAGLAATVAAGPSTRLLGPNCLGVYDAAAELCLAWGSFTPGGLAVVSQSGQLGLEIAGAAASARIGVSRFVSVGSQLDVTAAEVLDDLADHAATRVVALYLESFGDGERLLGTLDRLRRAGKHVLVLTVGASGAARRTALSHTGSMTSGVDVVDAACRAVGAVRVDTPAQLADTAQLLMRSRPVRGPRVAIVADSGGQAAVAADTAARLGLDVTPFPPALRHHLARRLPSQSAVTNPVDLAGAGEQDLTTYASTVTAAAAAGVADAVVLSGYFGSYGRDIPAQQPAESAAARELGAVAAEHRVPVVVHSMAEDTDTIGELRDAGVPTYRDVEGALRAVATAGRLAEAPLRRAPRTEPAGVDVTAGAGGRGYGAARELLRAAGVAFPRAVVLAPGVTDPRPLVAGLTAPFVLKADWLEHKTEQQGVVLGLRTADELAAAHADMVERLGQHRFVVEEMDPRPGVVELLVAARRDPSFGPVVVVGAGGVRAELDPDLALELAPCTAATARAMLRRLRVAPLLDGWRGAPPLDVTALAEVIVTVSRLLAARPELAEIELNPVRVAATGALAVDALIVPSSPRTG
ncbi:acetate--CoA ligase family protein [Streptomyces xanthii]|uniref:acetate--CoA ligase family protein n=1 Tax=Streptomyces xanthii TaxID=2768069 RepID=UPI001CB798C0|nr:acetate--CoA ligase family protein [Streptomyces xanthii]